MNISLRLCADDDDVDGEAGHINADVDYHNSEDHVVYEGLGKFNIIFIVLLRFNVFIATSNIPFQ